jgi:NADPH:quinone reductase-like Zn-dependent oxidoreductase
MRAAFITRHGPPDVLQLREAPDPEPGPGEIRIAVRAAGINFADIMQRMGLYPTSFKIPYAPGFEAAGIIDRIGPGVTTWREGDRAAALVPCGGYASMVVTAADRAVPLPPAMTFEEAAAMPVVYVTAYHMMVRQGQLRRGERILIHTAAGGVGLAAIQLARWIGATTLGTASPSKHGYLREQGLDHPIDYRTGDWAAEVRRITNNEGVDMILDPLGGSATKINYGLLAPQGRLCVFGFSRAASGERPSPAILRELIREMRIKPRQLMMDNKTIIGAHIGRMDTPKEAALLLEELGELRKLYEQGHIHPIVGKTFPLAQAAEAHRFIQRRENIGKVLLIP